MAGGHGGPSAPAVGKSGCWGHDVRARCSATRPSHADLHRRSWGWRRRAPCRGRQDRPRAPRPCMDRQIDRHALRSGHWIAGHEHQSGEERTAGPLRRDCMNSSESEFAGGRLSLSVATAEPAVRSISTPVVDKHREPSRATPRPPPRAQRVNVIKRGAAISRFRTPLASSSEARWVRLAKSCAVHEACGRHVANKGGGCGWTGTAPPGGEVGQTNKLAERCSGASRKRGIASRATKLECCDWPPSMLLPW